MLSNVGFYKKMCFEKEIWIMIEEKNEEVQKIEEMLNTNLSKVSNELTFDDVSVQNIPEITGKFA